ncbi:unnamed protein product [Fraxinus pennsylvanica]|uniref:Uncharacterized protein n=1 Tax=Fraxinus pennsylvanica TaxID=56036 RepID=A0AAD2DIW6_9LAMI|nr:unnamed protein product [Fraxinus pennsylvanica]
MLSLGKFPLKSICNAIPSQNFHFPIKTHFLFSPNFYSFGKKPTGFCLHALKTKKRGDFSGLKLDGPDEFANDFEDEFIDIETDGDFEEDDEADIPLKEMEKWLENKPRGFGEGKVYDTSIEDKLMEELEQSRKAQLANINKLKNNPQQFTSKKEQNQQEKGILTLRNVETGTDVWYPLSITLLIMGLDRIFVLQLGFGSKLNPSNV